MRNAASSKPVLRVSSSGGRLFDRGRQWFCVFIDTVGEGSVPSVRNGEGKPALFATRVEAEREIADLMMTRLQEFMDGQREFDDAMTVEEYVVEVDAQSDGAIITTNGHTFR